MKFTFMSWMVINGGFAKVKNESDRPWLDRSRIEGCVELSEQISRNLLGRGIDARLQSIAREHRIVLD